MKIEVIIPNYNGSDLIKKNLPKVLDALEKRKDTIITIVDDGSKPEEQEALSVFIPEVVKTTSIKINLQIHEKNVGFSSNINRAAMKSTADILILLNSDVSPQKDFLQPLLDHFEDETVFGVGCMDKSIEDDGTTVLRGRGLAKWHNGFLVHRKGEIDKSNTFWVSGGSCAVRTDIFQKLGGFDPLYNPFYWEDIDISYRAQKAGYKLIFESKSIVTHMHAKGAIKKHYRDNVIKSYAMRNQFTFIWKNITDLDLILSHLLRLPYYLLTSCLSKDTIFLKGFYLAIVRLPDIMRHRKKQKKLFVLSDKAILASFKHDK